MFEPLQEVAKQTGLKYYWLQKMAKAGKLPAIRTSPNGKWLAEVEDVKRFASQMKQAA